MDKVAFLDDYSEGCHPRILDALAGTNLMQQPAYGHDAYSIDARARIAAQIGNPDASIHFVASGTMANIVSIASCLKPHEAVIAAQSGHIALREAGAIEATGHKVITMPSTDGKLTVVDVEAALQGNAHFPHMARPRMLYISNATEMGTVYRHDELQALSRCCRQHDLLLLIDGARLGAAIAAEGDTPSLQQLAGMADIFWIGGTKAGALFGEAIIVNHPQFKDDMAFHLKQRGALLAKGRALGIQFAELFKENLFFDLARHANQMAGRISTAVVEAGYSLAAATESNQVFPILPDSVIEELGREFDFYTWESRESEQSVIRLVTSWATTDGNVDAFVDCLRGAGARFAI